MPRLLRPSGMEAEIAAGPVPGTWRLRRNLPARGMVSIVIPTAAAGGYVETCINTLRERTAYRDFEIVCIENIPPHLVREPLADNAERGPWRRPVQLVTLQQYGRGRGTGEYLLFLNDDIEIDQPDWLDAMLDMRSSRRSGWWRADCSTPTARSSMPACFSPSSASDDMPSGWPARTTLAISDWRSCRATSPR